MEGLFGQSASDGQTSAGETTARSVRLFGCLARGLIRLLSKLRTHRHSFQSLTRRFENLRGRAAEHSACLQVFAKKARAGVHPGKNEFCVKDAHATLTTLPRACDAIASTLALYPCFSTCFSELPT